MALVSVCVLVSAFHRMGPTIAVYPIAAARPAIVPEDHASWKLNDRILGLGAMSKFDRNGRALNECFGDAPDLTP
jgi:hypothetical protein